MNIDYKTFENGKLSTDFSVRRNLSTGNLGTQTFEYKNFEYEEY